MELYPHIVSGFTNSGMRDFGLGASIGYNMMDNMWLSAGYNLRGMNDRDFANASYRAQAPYITLRMKIDQDTLGLNKSRKMTGPAKSATGGKGN